MEKAAKFYVALLILVILCVLPTITDAKVADTFLAMEQRYGQYRLVEDSEGRYWTEQQWLAPKNENVSAKRYGYMAKHGSMDVTIWAEYDSKGLIVKELYIPAYSMSVYEFKKNFAELYANIAASDNQFFNVEYRGGLSEADYGAVYKDKDGKQYCIRFLIKNSRIQAFETSEAKSAGNLSAVLHSTANDWEQWSERARLFESNLAFAEKFMSRKKTDMLVIHHTATEMLFVEDIHRMHLTNGWAGVGYHKIILPNGIIEDGRPEKMIGAHAYGVNDRSIGITLVGNFEKHPPTARQLESLIKLVRTLAQKYRIEPQNIVGHRDVSDTVCPGRLFPWDEFKRAL